MSQAAHMENVKFIKILLKKKCIEDVNLRVDGRILLKYMCKTNVTLDRAESFRYIGGREFLGRPRYY